MPPSNRRLAASGHQGTALVQTGDQESVSQNVGGILDCMNPGFVAVGGSMTVNLGDYESVKVSVTVTLPSFPDDASMKKTYTRCARMVDEFLNKELAVATNKDG